jgi:hypothetical protein
MIPGSKMNIIKMSVLAVKYLKLLNFMLHVHQLRIIGFIDNFVLKVFVPEGNGFCCIFVSALGYNRGLLIENGERDDILRCFGGETQLFY